MEKRLVCAAAGAIAAIAMTGCLSMETGVSPADEREYGSSTKVIEAVVTGVEPHVEWHDGDCVVRISLTGTLRCEATKSKVRYNVERRYLSAGFFPGTMACRGEYSDCVVNGLAAFYYNIVFVGLPTVYGLIVEPFIPYYPAQAESVVGKNAFLNSPMIGFARYCKSGTEYSKVTVPLPKKNRWELEDAVLSAPKFNLKSERGEPLRINGALLKGAKTFDVAIALPEGHPLKNAMGIYEGVKITVPCGRNDSRKGM